ncbi:MAG: GyrI-like domain-containing protein [Candidatus Aminicenantes bacterium]|nr:GyrI-like domain-containing protein [Candidatus Aminicenantes bacterium]
MSMKHRFHSTVPAIVAMSLFSSLSIAAPPTASPAASSFQESFASIKEVPPFAYCCIVHKGPISDISNVIGQLIQAMQEQNIFSAIRGPMVAVYYNTQAPADSPDLAWEVGFIVTEQTMPQAPLIKKVWSHNTVAATTHVGPYRQIGETIEKLVAWVGAQGYAANDPLLERYLNSPMQVKPQELRTEIWIPIVKK